MAKNSQSRKISQTFWLALILLLALCLRLFRFNQIPASLFGDEVDTGYQAWSILKTGRDYFGNPFPLHFQSFGDWRMPLYIYLTTPLMAVLGPTELATRLPSLIFSFISLVVVYFLIKEISQKEKLALLTTFFLAISPWHFHFSRISLEVGLFNLLFLTGLLLFLKSLKTKKPGILILASVSFGLALYAYPTAKLFIPAILVCLGLLFRKEAFLRKKALLTILVFLLLSFPIIKDSFFGQGGARFGSISIFSTPDVAERVRLEREKCPYSGSWERLLHNKFSIYLKDFSDNYFQSFSTSYLFTRGDPNPRHNPTEKGQLYPIFLPLILLGGGGLLSQFLKNKDKRLILPFIFLVLTPIPAALTQSGGTHAIRTYEFLPWWQFLAASGLIWLVSQIKTRLWRKLLILAFVFSLLINAFSFFHDYFSHFPNQPGRWWRWWNWGYRETFKYLNQVQADYEQIYLSPAYDPPIVYALFYHQYPPPAIQKEINISSIGFSKFIFANPDLSFLKTGEKKEGILFVVTPGYAKAVGYDLADQGAIKILKEINYPDGETAFFIFKTL
jgi:4-amino-4-deoxy-L-arabinose transferase-like glycosyltransferase